MKTITDTFKIDEFHSRAFDSYFKGFDVCVYDIETTGLFARQDRIMLTGILTLDGASGTAIAKQLFAESPDDEKELLIATMDELNKHDVMLTYNGKSFDAPFTLARAGKYGIDGQLPFDLDLFLVLSGHSDIKKITGSLSQKSVEKYMGLTTSRDDRIDGYESIRLYNRYLESPSYDLEQKILLHNHDDICQLYRILPVIKEADFHKAMFSLGFPVMANKAPSSPAAPQSHGAPRARYIITNVHVGSSGLVVKALNILDPKDYISFPTEERPYSLRMDSMSGEAELEIPGEIIKASGDDFDGVLNAGSTANPAPQSYFVIDAQRILGPAYSEIEENAKKYPSFENGYLIVKQGSRINYFETCYFIKNFFANLDQ